MRWILKQFLQRFSLYPVPRQVFLTAGHRLARSPVKSIYPSANELHELPEHCWGKKNCPFICSGFAISHFHWLLPGRQSESPTSSACLCLYKSSVYPPSLPAFPGGRIIWFSVSTQRGQTPWNQPCLPPPTHAFHSTKSSLAWIKYQHQKQNRTNLFSFEGVKFTCS